MTQAKPFRTWLKGLKPRLDDVMSVAGDDKTSNELLSLLQQADRRGVISPTPRRDS